LIVFKEVAGFRISFPPEVDIKAGCGPYKFFQLDTYEKKPVFGEGSKNIIGQYAQIFVAQ
jgi:hypothetical protein